MIEFTRATPYKLTKDTLEQGVMTVENSPTSFAWGFFFPVFVDAYAGGTRVTVGIQSEFFQFGPVVTHHLQKVAVGIESQLA